VTKQLSFSVVVQDGDVTLDVEAEVWFTPGKVTGPPEDCYPPEGEVEVKSVFIDGHEVGIETWSRYEQQIEEAAWEEFDRT
jgi:hypothetical protein